MIFKLDKKTVYPLGGSLFLLALDRLLKQLALATAGQEAELVPGLLKFGYSLNPYIAFSLPLRGPLLLTAIILILIALIVWLGRLIKAGYLYPSFLVWLIILGASSNLYDRLRYFGVVDYLDLEYFTVFNLADAMITLSAAAIFILALRKRI